MVEERIRAERPSHVLIEGPADMNERLAELTLGHTFPIAAFSFLQDEDNSLAAWSPFCEYSPEWVALRVGQEVGAEVRFIDLPAWVQERRGDADLLNRYSDEGAHHSAYVGALCKELGVEGMDNLWDHLFEQPMEPEVLSERLATYFTHLRSDLPAAQDEAREDYMARFIAWAMKAATTQSLNPAPSVVVVCGGWHKPALETQWQQHDGTEPDLPRPPEGSRIGTYLVPYSYERMDSFTGYQSACPPPRGTGTCGATGRSGPARMCCASRCWFCESARQRSARPISSARRA